MSIEHRHCVADKACFAFISRYNELKDKVTTSSRKGLGFSTHIEVKSCILAAANQGHYLRTPPPKCFVISFRVRCRFQIHLFLGFVREDATILTWVELILVIA